MKTNMSSTSFTFKPAQAVALAAGLVFGALTPVQATEINVTTMEFFDAGLTLGHTNNTVSGSIDFTTGIGNINSGTTPFFGISWTANVVESWDAPGSYNYAGTVPAGNISPAAGTPFDYPFTLAANQFAAGLRFNWGSNTNIPVLAVFECVGGTPNLIALDSDGDGAPGTAMQTGPFLNQTPAFSGELVAGLCPGFAVAQPSVVNDGGATLNAGDVDPTGDGTVTLSQIISAGIPIDDALESQCIGGCFDFTITGLTETAAVVVLPLSAPLPAAPIYRKWNGTQWVNFDTTNGNAIASANQIAPGQCPDSGYTAGLTKSHTCVRLTIVDGGANDLDGAINGEIVDPGGVGERVIPTASTSLGSGIGGGCTLTTRPASGIPGEWLLIGGLLAALGLYRRRRVS